MKVKDIDLVKEAKEYFTEYALDVIIDRAIPSVLDGLKPVHRKILYCMHELKLNHKASRRKVNTISGHTLSYSVHGESSIQEAIAVAGAWFKTNVPFIDGMGNYGSIDGSDAAAGRYIEARLSEYSDVIMLDDLTKASVEWMKTYDDTLDEPVYLPVKLPNILINGCPYGIAVGYACSHLPHNPLDVIELCTKYVQNRNMSVDEMIDVLKAPDFPTGGIINGLGSVANAYRTGKGSVSIRGKYEVIEDGGYKTIRIVEVPFGVTTTQIYTQIAKLADMGDIRLKSDGLQDHTDRTGIKIELTLRKDEDVDRVLNVLYKNTEFEHKIMVLLNVVTKDKKLKLATLDYIVSEFVKFRGETIWRKLRDILETKSKRYHLLSGMEIIANDLDRAIKLIRAAKGKADAKAKLMKTYKLDDAQAEYVVMIPVYRLNSVDINEIRKECKGLLDDIKHLEKITKTKANKYIDKIMVDEWNILKNTLFKDYKRKTKINSNYKHIDITDTIRTDPVTIIVTREGYIKKVMGTNTNPFDLDPVSLGISIEDEIHEVIYTQENKNITVLTNTGKVYTIKVYTLDANNKRGKLLRNIVAATDSESIVDVWEEITDGRGDILTITSKGMLKSTSHTLLVDLNATGRILHQLSSNDSVVGVCRASDDILIGTAKGQVLRLKDKVAHTGLGGVGVKGIKLKEGDYVIGIISTKKEFIVCTVDGRYKTMKVSDFTAQSRGGYGLIGYNCSKDQTVIGIKGDKGCHEWITNCGISIGYIKIAMDKPQSKTSKGKSIPTTTAIVYRLSDYYGGNVNAR